MFFLEAMQTLGTQQISPGVVKYVIGHGGSRPENHMSAVKITAYFI